MTLNACGGDGDPAKTVVQTVTAPAEPPVPVPPPTQTRPDTQTAPSEPSEPLPEGVIGADGTYAVRFKKSDYVTENLIVDEQSPSQSEWRFETTCKGSSCSIEMKRELGSGGFKVLTMRPANGRSRVFEGKTTSTDKCLIDPERVSTRQRYSIRLYDPVDRNGRQTARRIDVYMTEDPEGCEEDTKGTISWGATLK